MRLLTEDEVARFRERRERPAFAAAWEALAERARGGLAGGIDVPARGGGWTHDYFCPDHATRLEYDPATPHGHRCPVDGRVFSGEPYDGAWRTLTVTRLTDGLYAAALAWLGSGREDYAAHAGAVLDAFADRYPDYEVHGEHAGQGRCLGQSLDEAVWSVPLARAYDAVREALAPERRARIEERLLRPAGEHLLGQLWRRTHNIECWHLAGLASLGAVLDEERFIAPALDEQHGLGGQLREGVLADGWWWEGSPTYHFYTLRAVLSLMTALRFRHPHLLDQPRLRAMLAAPPALARADLSLPATNDGWFAAAEPGFLASHAPLYEIAGALWDDPAYGALLARFYAGPWSRGAGGTPRRAVEALLFGPDPLPPAASPATASLAQEASGYAVFRGGAGERERWLLLKYGPHGGGHGHPDKLALDLHAFGRRLSPDLGTPGYGIPMNKTWYRHTLSHNTVLLDMTSQPPATGELICFSPPGEGVGGFGVADARVAWPEDAPAPYGNAVARRCILWKPGERPYFIDIVRVRCAAPCQIDLAWHHTGELDLPGDFLVHWADTRDAYAHLREIYQLRAREWDATWRYGPVGTACWALDPPHAVTVNARAPYNPASEAMSLALRRVLAREALFVAVVEPFDERPTIEAVRWLDHDFARAGRVALTVERAGGRDAWLLSEGARPGAPDTGALGDAVVHEYALEER